MAERINDLENHIDVEYAIRKIDMGIDEFSRKSFDCFHRADDGDVLIAKHFLETLDTMVSILEYQNNKIKELEKKIGVQRY